MNKGVLPLNQAGSQQGGLLAVCEYNVPSQIATGSSTFVDVDATNLKVAFAAPSSGKVLVNLEAMCYSGTTTTYAWNLRDALGDIANTKRDMYYGGNSLILRLRCGIYVTGLTPGASYIWKWGHGLTFGTVSSGINGNGASESAIMAVSSA